MMSNPQQKFKILFQDEEYRVLLVDHPSVFEYFWKRIEDLFEIHMEYKPQNGIKVYFLDEEEDWCILDKNVWDSFVPNNLTQKLKVVERTSRRNDENDIHDSQNISNQPANEESQLVPPSDSSQQNQQSQDLSYQAFSLTPDEKSIIKETYATLWRKTPREIAESVANILGRDNDIPHFEEWIIRECKNSKEVNQHLSSEISKESENLPQYYPTQPPQSPQHVSPNMNQQIPSLSAGNHQQYIHQNQGMPIYPSNQPGNQPQQASGYPGFIPNRIPFPYNQQNQAAPSRIIPPPNHSPYGQPNRNIPHPQFPPQMPPQAPIQAPQQMPSQMPPQVPPRQEQVSSHDRVEELLNRLAAMGFTNRDENRKHLEKYGMDLSKTVQHLLKENA